MGNVESADERCCAIPFTSCKASPTMGSSGGAIIPNDRDMSQQSDGEVHQNQDKDNSRDNSSLARSITLNLFGAVGIYTAGSGPDPVQMLSEKQFALMSRFAKRWVIRNRIKRLVKMLVESNPATLKAMRTRNEVLHEIARTEESYYRGLLILEHCFIQPIQDYYESEMVHAGQLPIAEWRDFVTVAQSIVDIHEKCSELIGQQVKAHDLVQGGDDADLSATFCALFKTDCIPHLYPIFFNRQTSIDHALHMDRCANLILHNSCYKEITVTARDGKTYTLTPGGLGFQAYLIKPMQRIAGYGMLLQRLSSLTPESHCNAESLQAAFKTMQVVGQKLEQINQDYAVLENVQRRFCNPYENFKKEGRRFLKEGRICHLMDAKLAERLSLVASPSLSPQQSPGASELVMGPVFECHVEIFLLSDLLLVGRPITEEEATELASVCSFEKAHQMLRQRKLNIEHRLQIRGMTITTDGENATIFAVSGGLDHCAFKAATVEKALEWVSAISEAIDGQELQHQKRQAKETRRRVHLQSRSLIHGTTAPTGSPSRAPQEILRLTRASSFEANLDEGIFDVAGRYGTIEPPDLDPMDLEFMLRIRSAYTLRSSERYTNHQIRLCNKCFMRISPDGYVTDSHKYSHVLRCEITGDQECVLFFVAYHPQKVWHVQCKGLERFVQALVSRAQQSGVKISTHFQPGVREFEVHDEHEIRKASALLKTRSKVFHEDDFRRVRSGIIPESAISPPGIHEKGKVSEDQLLHKARADGSLKSSHSAFM